MNDSLTIYNQYDQLERAATALMKSGYFKDVTSQYQAVVKVMAGAELGLPPFAAMSGIHIIQGKPVLGANVIATLVKNDPRYNYKVKQCNGATCELIWFEDGKEVGISSFTLDEAKGAGLTGKDNWTKYPSDMLFARAISRGARRYAPGIFGGSPVYTPDEMGVDTDEEGHIITVEPSNNGHEPDPEQPAIPEPVMQAMERKGRDGRKYGDLTDDELNTKINDLLNRLDAINDNEKRKPIETAIKQCETILEYRTNQGIAA